MHTPETEMRDAGLGEAAKQVAERASALARLEIELAQLEVGRKIRALALGIGLGVAAAVFGVFALGFGLAAAAAAVATAVSTWLALLIVTGALFALAGLLGGLALRSIKKGAPPVPDQAIAEAKLTTSVLRSDGNA